MLSSYDIYLGIIQRNLVLSNTRALNTQAGIASFIVGVHDRECPVTPLAVMLQFGSNWVESGPTADIAKST